MVAKVMICGYFRVKETVGSVLVCGYFRVKETGSLGYDLWVFKGKQN